MSKWAQRCNIAKWCEHKIQISIFISDTHLYIYWLHHEKLHQLKHGCCLGDVGVLEFIRLSWEILFFFCKSTSGPCGVQTLHPGNASVKLLQLSNRKHHVKYSLETSIQTILSCLQVAGGRFAQCHISLFKRVREGSVKCSVSSPGPPLPSHLSAFSIWLWLFSISATSMNYCYRGISMWIAERNCGKG